MSGEVFAEQTTLRHDAVLLTMLSSPQVIRGIRQLRATRAHGVMVPRIHI